MTTKVKVNKVRIAFIQNLFKAAEYAPGDGRPRYSATLLIEPGSDNDKAINEAIIAECKAAFGAKWEVRYKALKNDSKSYCYQDGNLKDYEGFEDMMALSAHRREIDGPPKIINKDKSPVSVESGIIYAGCYVNASFDIYVQSKGNVGVRSALLAIQFAGKGDAFVGSKPTDEDFDDISDPEDGDDDGLDDLVG